MINYEEIQDITYEALVNEEEKAVNSKRYERYSKRINKKMIKAAKNGSLSYYHEVMPWEDKLVFWKLLEELEEKGYQIKAWTRQWDEDELTRFEISWKEVKEVGAHGEESLDE